ncbi:MAG: helix-turn-helix transcriptional regulator [Deltaproteobacteria bacterium]|nr:helix-turn-helix transcriptional regulator [Deltaproteobacteria bacterium]
MKQDTQKELERLGIGRTVRALREQQRISTEEFASKIDLTPVLLGQIEDDVIPPTIGTLLNMSKILGVNIDYFFRKKSSLEKIELTRAGERLIVPKGPHSNAARLTYKYQALSYRLQGKKMEPFLIEFDTETEENLIPLSHEGEEFIFCLSGEIEFISEKTRITLEAGDALYYFSSLPHVLKGKGAEKPRALAVLLPGTENSAGV